MPAYSFESLLKELGEKLGLPNLESTRENNITLTLKGKNEVVLQKHNTEPLIIISFEIAELPASRYRENIFREALKFNGLNQLHAGVFAFSKKTQKFFLFDMLPLNDTSVEQVQQVINTLAEKAALWRESINRGEIPTLTSSSQARSGGGILG
ncbi:MAG: CesT family type III secretion system chaperone [Parachlamydiaceae bacterium]|nr:MAG: CesT family type III secretion system chaperone [Parachlamydiaceae bacterium]